MNSPKAPTFGTSRGQGLAARVLGRGAAAANALKPQLDVISQNGVRVRARSTSGLAYGRGPASGVPAAAGGQAPQSRLRAAGELKPGAQVQVRTHRGWQGGRVLAHQKLSRDVHRVKVHAKGDVWEGSVRRTSAREYADHANTPRPGAAVASALPSPQRGGPRGGAKAPSTGRINKDAMTVTEDLGHDGQSPVTIMQGGSTLQKCPKCGYKLSSDGHCPKHGNVLAVKRHFRTGGAVILKDMDTTYIPSTGEARAPLTTHPHGPNRKKPKQNNPVGPPECPDCGGTDGYHNPMCPRAILNPGGGAAGLGA